MNFLDKLKDFRIRLRDRHMFTIVISSFLVGIVVIKFLLEYLKKGSFKVFAIYRVVLGIIVIALTLIK